jgi:hypothetical protein
MLLHCIALQQPGVSRTQSYCATAADRHQLMNLVLADELLLLLLLLTTVLL